MIDGEKGKAEPPAHLPAARVDPARANTTRRDLTEAPAGIASTGGPRPPALPLEALSFWREAGSGCGRRPNSSPSVWPFWTSRKGGVRAVERRLVQCAAQFGAAARLVDDVDHSLRSQARVHVDLAREGLCQELA